MSTNNSSVNETGSNSQTTIINNSSSTESYNSTVTSSSSNSTNTTVNTGNNSASYSTNVDGVGSGNAVIQISSSNTVASSPGGSELGATTNTGSSNSTTISSTGDHSTTTVRNTDVNNIAVSVVNNSSVTNRVDTSVNTGNNHADQSTNVAGVTSGSATVIIGITNHVGDKGGGTDIIVPPPTPNIPPTSIITNPEILLGKGGDVLVQPVSTSAPRYFAAGSDLFLGQGLALLLITFLGVGLSLLYRRVRRFFVFTIIVGLAAALALGGYSTPTFAASSDPSSTIVAVGPTVETGPTVQTGPTVETGPTVQTGPVITSKSQNEPVPSVATSPAPLVGEVSAEAVVPAEVSPAATEVVSDVGATSSTITNNVVTAVDTGDNSATQTTNVTSGVSSGDIRGGVTLINATNSSFGTGSSVGTQSVDAGDSQNVVLTPSTERSSLNTNSVLQGTNSTEIGNNAVVLLNTGRDGESEVTNGNGISSGNIQFGVTYVNLANMVMPDTQVTVDTWSVLLGQNADITIAGNNDSNSADQSTLTGITVNQHADVGNNLHITTNTGDNSVSRTTNAGELTSGNTDLNISTVTVANPVIPTFYVVNVFGEWDGTLQGVPAGSYVINQVDASSGEVITTGTADLSNNLTLDANTGHLYANEVTNLPGGIHSGNISLRVSLVNFLNGWGNNLSQFNLRVINIFAHPTTGAANPSNTPPIAQTEIMTNSATNPVTNLTQAITPDNSTTQTFQVTTSHLRSVRQDVSSGNSDSSTASNNEQLALNTTIGDISKALAMTVSDKSASSGQGHFPLGLLLLGIVAGGWIGIELLAHAERNRGF